MQVPYIDIGGTWMTNGYPKLHHIGKAAYTKDWKAQTMLELAA